jgi:hypothetical protein
MYITTTIKHAFSLIEAYAPHLNLTYCEGAAVKEECIKEVHLLILLVCQHVYLLTISRDKVTLLICP